MSSCSDWRKSGISSRITVFYVFEQKLIEKFALHKTIGCVIIHAILCFTDFHLPLPNLLAENNCFANEQ